MVRVTQSWVGYFQNILWFIALFIAPIAKVNAQYIQSNEFKLKLRFGSEMTISSNELYASYPKNQVVVETDVSEITLMNLENSIRHKYETKKGPKPRFTSRNYHSNWDRKAFTITYPNGFQLTMFPDPGVIELNSSASTLADIENNLAVIQEDFFDEGKKIGLEPALFSGSGHIHIEVTKVHPVTVRNFLADFANATGLSAGALNEDIYNALGVGELPEANKQKLREAFARFDEKENPTKSDIPLLFNDAYEIPYALESADYKKSRKQPRSKKYHSISFNSFFKLGTIELRAIRPQASAQSYLKLIKLFTARMELAERKRLNGIRVPLASLKSLRGNPQAVLGQFNRYLTEVDLDINDYREFVLPWWQIPDADFDQYIRKRQSRTEARTAQCRNLFN